MIRRMPNLTEKLAACLLMLKRGTGEPLVPEPERTSGTADEICRSVVFQHEHPFALGGRHDPRLLTPMRKEDHDKITREIDIPRIAKSKRLTKAHKQHNEILLSKAGQGDAQSKIRKRGRSLTSQKLKKKVCGEVVPRIPEE